MGSIEEPEPIYGQFMLPLITKDSKNSDPNERNYFQPPTPGPLTATTFPLYDVRDRLSDPHYSPLDLLKSHGFGVVKHHSSFLDQLEGDLDDDAVKTSYNPEVEKLVMETLGASYVSVVATVFRQGKRQPEEYKLPTGLKPASAAMDGSKPHKLATQSALKASAPIRVPHLDYTPLGARQVIRFESQESRQAAEQRGIIAAEDDICAARSIDAVSKESDSVIAEQYNANGKLGPRYAGYSIWRPLRRVGRDPIALAARKEVPRAVEGLRHWFYENRIPGPAALKGDYRKEFAMLGREEEVPGARDLKFYYLSGQEPDEVLFIKLFDSASLGEDSEHAGAPWHASPELFDAAESNAARESIEARVLVFY